VSGFLSFVPFQILKWRRQHSREIIRLSQGVNERVKGIEPSFSPMSGKTESRKTRITEFPHAKNDLKKTKTEKKQSLVATTQLRWSVADGWQGLSDELRKRLIKAYPACSIDRQFAAMDLWLRGNPQKANKKQWLRFVTGWLERNQERGNDIRSTRKLPDPNPLPDDPRTWKPKY